MLKKIKSSYISKIVFSFVDEGKKLSIIKFSKISQNILEINMTNYILYFDTFIIYGDNNIGKEYNIYDNKLIYEGEFFKRKRNGEGKEYE